MDPDFERWDLSAPSSQVLLTGAATPNSWAIKLAFKELVLRGGLVLQKERQRHLLIRTREVDALAMGRWPRLETERPLLGVMEAYPKAALFQSAQGGVPIEVAGEEVRRWFQPGGGYVHAAVLPELERRGFYRRVETERGTQWQLTDAGEQKLVDLRARMETGRVQFPVWVQGEPDRAAAYVASAGVALLLLGNPVQWLWSLLTELLTGGTLSGGQIPRGAGHPFAIPPAQERTEQNSDRNHPGPTWTTSTEGAGTARVGESGSPGQAIDSTPDAGGGGGGEFDSPGETIDAGFGEGDADGGSGDGE